MINQPLGISRQNVGIGLGKRKLLGLVGYLCLLTVFTNLAFPKAGIYIGEIPINFGYILLFISGVFSFLSFLLGKIKLEYTSTIGILFLLTFSLYSIGSIFILGSTESLGSRLGYTVSVFIVPILTIFCMNYLLSHVSMEQIYLILLRSFGIILFFGLVSFLSANLTREVIGIPFLTFTGAEYNIADRHIDRGAVIKMVSTYNNGNILGVNLVIWSPILLILAPRWIRWSVRLVFLLTVSRTVWIGWMIVEVAKRIYILPKKVNLILILLSIPSGMALVYGLLWAIGIDPLKFLLDANLGGRLEQLNVATRLFSSPFTGILEIVYLGILKNFGIFGSILFIMTWVFPLAIPTRDMLSKLAKVGLLAYILIMWSDGAFILVPTQFTYWMVASLILFQNLRKNK